MGSIGNPPKPADFVIANGALSCYPTGRSEAILLQGKQIASKRDAVQSYLAMTYQILLDYLKIDLPCFLTTCPHTTQPAGL